LGSLFGAQKPYCGLEHFYAAADVLTVERRKEVCIKVVRGSDDGGGGVVRISTIRNIHQF